MKRIIIAIIAALAIGLIAYPAFPQVATKGYVTAVTLTSTSVEYSLDLGQGIKAFMVRPRTEGDVVKVAFSVGDTALDYVTVGEALPEFYSPAVGAGITLYLKGSRNGMIVEVNYWR